jgi:TPR repeat protein
VSPLTSSLNNWLREKLGLPSIEWRSARYRAWEFRHAGEADLRRAERDEDALTRARELATNGDQVSAFRIWQEQASEGSVWAMYELALCYRRGKGVTSDDESAEEWCRRAFEGGSERALLWYIGMLARRGDYVQAEAVCTVSAEKGSAAAIYWLAWFRIRRSAKPATYRSVRPLLEEAAAAGNPRAIRVLGYWMAHGRFGLREVPAGLRLAWETSGLEFDEFRAEQRAAA